MGEMYKVWCGEIGCLVLVWVLVYCVVFWSSKLISIIIPVAFLLFFLKPTSKKSSKPSFTGTVRKRWWH